MFSPSTVELCFWYIAPMLLNARSWDVDAVDSQTTFGLILQLLGLTAPVTNQNAE